MSYKAQSRKKGRGRYTNRPRALADLVDNALTPLCRKQGFASSDIIRFWSEIVGPGFDDCTEPECIRWPRGGDKSIFKPGTLVLRCEGARALYLQHEEAMIIERINTYFGYAAIERIHIIQRPVHAPKQEEIVPARPLNKEEAARLDHDVEGIQSQRLAEALRRWGKAVYINSDDDGR